MLHFWPQKCNCMLAPLGKKNSTNLTITLYFLITFFSLQASRGATLVAAYLMKSKKWPLSLALTELQVKRPCVCPNEGFVDQLRLFEAMRCKLDVSFLPYKLYKLNLIHQQVLKAKILPAQVKKTLQKLPLQQKCIPSSSSATTTPNSETSSGTESPHVTKGIFDENSQYVAE